MNAELEFKQLIDRILRCREAEDEAKQDTKEVYAELKSRGYDKTAAGALVAEIRKKDKNPDQFAERNAVLDTYREAYHRASHAHTREARISTGEITEPENQSEQPCTATGPSASTGNASDIIPATLSHAPVNVPPQAPADDVTPLASSAPLPKNDLCADATLSGARQSHGPDPHELGAAIHEELKSGTQNQTNPLPNLSPSPEPVSSQVEADRAGEVVSSPTSPAILSKTIRDYRPHCQHPECCGASGLSHCHECQKIADAAESEAA